MIFEDGLDEELDKCLPHGRAAHETFMRKMAVRQYRETTMTNRLLTELLAQHHGGTTGGNY